MKFSILRSRTIALFMLTASVILYWLDYQVAGKSGEVIVGFLGNLAFLPIYVLFVTLMIERVIKERERSAIRQKLNMVIGVFFSEVGTELIRDGFGFVQDADELRGQLAITPQWTDQQFRDLLAYLKSRRFNIDSRKGCLVELKGFLTEKRQFMLGLLENPNLLEHDEFSDLLWAVFHLLEELASRRSMEGLPPTDLDHLSGDISRAYELLIREWVVYMQHLKNDYPYLFSLAVRMNPMNPEAHAEIY